jgi:hypothetical protein
MNSRNRIIPACKEQFHRELSTELRREKAEKMEKAGSTMGLIMPFPFPSGFFPFLY